MMERPTTPRRASVIDAEGIAACHANCFSGAWDVAFISRLLADPARLAWVVEDTAGLTAFLIAAQAADEMEILSIGVVPDTRRKGCARALLESFHQEAAARRASRVFLDVASRNKAARALYEAAGYVEVGRRRAYYDNPGDGAPDDALVLQKTFAT